MVPLMVRRTASSASASVMAWPAALAAAVDQDDAFAAPQLLPLLGAEHRHGAALGVGVCLGSHAQPARWSARSKILGVALVELEGALLIVGQRDRGDRGDDGIERLGPGRGACISGHWLPLMASSYQ
jgi:hypothetical protein